MVLCPKESQGHHYQHSLVRGCVTLKPQECSYGKKDFRVVPRKAVRGAVPFHHRNVVSSETAGIGIRQISVPLDLGHADFGVPLDVWNDKYAKLPREDVLPALLHEPTLVAVYQTAQHLAPVTSKTNSGTSVWGQRRSVIGFYDGRGTEVLPPRSDGALAYKPEGFHWLGGLTLMSHHLGELQFMLMKPS